MEKSLPLRDEKAQKTNENLDIEELPERKKGRPLMLGEDLDKQVQAYLTALRQKGAVVNTAIAIYRLCRRHS